MDAVQRPGTRLALPGLAMLAVAVALGAWVLVRGSDTLAADAWWNAVVGTWRHPALDVAAHVLDRVGGFWVSGVGVTVAAAILLVAVRRVRDAVYLVAAQAGSALAVQVLKHVFGRARPEEILVISDYGSFPSGHTAAAATLAVVAAVLVRRRWVMVAGAGWVVVAALSRTYLHAHWLSDTAGGALVGAGVALVLAAAFASPARRSDAVS